MSITPINTFNDIINKYRTYSFSQRDKGARFERLMKNFLNTYQLYADKFQNIWLWNEFPFKKDFGGTDTGIDLVAQTKDNEFWAIQCKCYREDATIDKSELDTFLSTSSKTFKNDQLKTVSFSYRLWISTTNKWGINAENTITNQNPPVLRISLSDLQQAKVDWNELDKGITGIKAQAKKHIPKEHQQEAIDKVCKHFKTEDRAKLIMACGTGKTFTSLKIAEKLTDNKGLILVLVPSIALLGQLLKEWTEQSEKAINPICICSQAEVSKAKIEDGNIENIEDLALPASTDVKNILKQFEYIERTNKDGLKVVFSTYQSIDVISQAQKELNKQYKDKYIFDLIVCDEAHRTTGFTQKDEKDKAFTKVHYDKYIYANKRLYMTATPRLYSENVKQKAQEKDIVLCSMDDENIYGKEVYRISFGKAVEKNLLSDYKVLILTLEKNYLPVSLQTVIENYKTSKVSADDLTKLFGCISALSKRMLMEQDLLKSSDPNPMHKAVAFCQTINISNTITNIFNDHKDKYYDNLPEKERAELVNVESKHIDGTMSAMIRQEKLLWLKSAPTDTNECRILTNVRCLSEGVDVPSLDAVMFLAGKNSEIDIVQSVGRVMRKAPNKKYGYIIIPIIIPKDVPPEKALDNNENYKVIWQVLNALRAHDDRFNAMVNKISVNQKPDNILIGGAGTTISEGVEDYSTQPTQLILPLEYLNKLQNVIYARMVEKVGQKRYWEQWAKDVGQIAQRHIERINKLIKQDDKHKKAFEKFLNGIRKNINPSIQQSEVIEMLAQHLITKPVFEALFENYSFVKNNPMSKSMQKILDLIEDKSTEEDNKTLEEFYKEIKSRVEGIDNAEGKQKIIVELYEKFFKTAFPLVVEKLGIVYTPIEVVDFINNSVAKILKKEFNRNLSDENVHILDPFTGTGTFITRLLQTGLIDKKSIERKYLKELHCNEIVLLAYYIASINIETAFYDLMTDKSTYKSFNGICLTDTFQLGETDSETELPYMLEENSKRVKEQKKAPIQVIIGNPPYSAGQKSADDNAQNQYYEKLDTKIKDTYAKNTSSSNSNKLHDSYIKAFRWSTDRIEKTNGGIIAFVTNGSWLDNQAMDGFRQCLEEDFNLIYVFNLRGDQRTKGEISRKEGGKIFGSGSRTPVAITILVKNPKVKKDKAKILYYEVEDYLKREQKLLLLKNFNNILNPEINLKQIKPNKENDWINQRNDKFSTYIHIEPDKKFDFNSNTYFILNSLGNQAKMSGYCYNFSSNKTKWNEILKNINQNFDKSNLKEIVFRPFSKQSFYKDKSTIHRKGQWDILLNDKSKDNKFICVSGIGGSIDFSAFITNTYSDYQIEQNSQIFPLYYYETNQLESPTLFDTTNETYIRKDCVSDFILKRCHEQYGKRVSKEDIFYYVYGILHSKDYKTTFANDLKKMLPRIPLVDIPADFWSFSKAGRELAELHLNYETIKPLKQLKVIETESNNFDVGKMRFKSKEDKSTILYNSHIKIENIPSVAYEYMVNGCSAIEWILDQYQVNIDGKTQITNNPNDWTKEHNNPRYILDLLLSVITVSVKTVKIVNNLPKLQF